MAFISLACVFLGVPGMPCVSHDDDGCLRSLSLTFSFEGCCTLSLKIENKGETYGHVVSPVQRQYVLYTICSTMLG